MTSNSGESRGGGGVPGHLLTPAKLPSSDAYNRGNWNEVWLSGSMSTRDVSYCQHSEIVAITVLIVFNDGQIYSSWSSRLASGPHTWSIRRLSVKHTYTCIQDKNLLPKWALGPSQRRWEMLCLSGMFHHSLGKHMLDIEPQARRS